MKKYLFGAAVSACVLLGTVAKAQNSSFTQSIKGTVIDAESKKPLQGALLQIFDEKNEVVGSGKTDKQGQLTLTGLDPGNYSVKELTAPKGYERSDQVIAFSLDEWGKTDRELVMKNCRARVPSAGTSPITIYLLPAVLATGIGTLILLILKRRLRVDN